MDLPLREMNQAKVGMMTNPDAVFISHITFSLKIKWDPDCARDGGSVGYTDGIHIGVQPNNFRNLTPKQRIWFLAHESWHVALKHIARLNGLNPRLWNIACDYVINTMLHDAGYDIPPDRYHDIKYRNMSAKQVYDLLLKEDPASLPDPDDDIKEPADGGGGDLPPELQQHIDQMIISAHVAQKEHDMRNGVATSLPGGMELLLQNLLEPMIPWETLLARFVMMNKRTRYSMMHPKAIFLPEFHIPSLKGKGLGNVAAAVDTSGSAMHMLTPFVSELYNLFASQRPEKLHVIDFDTRINNVHEITGLHQFDDLSFAGSGGTRIHEVIHWAIDNRPDFLIMLTDGEFPIPEEEPPVPVLWVIYDNPNFTAPYGEVAHIRKNR